MIPLDPAQEARFRDFLRSIDARDTCLVCDAGRWRAGYLDTIGLIARTCERCGHVLLFSPEPAGLTPGWRMTRRHTFEPCLVSTEAPAELAHTIRDELATAIKYR